MELVVAISRAKSLEKFLEDQAPRDGQDPASAADVQWKPEHRLLFSRAGGVLQAYSQAQKRAVDELGLCRAESADESVGKPLVGELYNALQSDQPSSLWLSSDPMQLATVRGSQPPPFPPFPRTLRLF